MTIPDPGTKRDVGLETNLQPHIPQKVETGRATAAYSSSISATVSPTSIDPWV